MDDMISTHRKGASGPRALTATARRAAAAPAFRSTSRSAERPPAPRSPAHLIELWHRAEPIRDEWLEVARSTGPADRATTEHLIAGIYRRLHRRAPAFRWVDSPHQALPLLTGMPTHRDLQSWVLARRPQGTPPVAGDIATALARLRGALDDAAAHPDLTATVKKPEKEDRHKPWPVLPPVRAIEAGVPLREVLRQSLQTPVAAGLTWPVRAALGPQGTVPVCWYGQQDATWIGGHDMIRKLGLANFRPRATPTSSTSGPHSPAPPAGGGRARTCACSWSGRCRSGRVGSDTGTAPRSAGELHS